MWRLIFLLCSCTPCELPIDDAPPSCELGGNGLSPPGVVIAHRYASTKEYLSSPTILRAPDGALVSTHDVPGHLPPTRPTLVYRSEDDGLTWMNVASINWLVFASLFEHEGKLYLLGTAGAYADVVLAESSDSGRTWTRLVILKGSFATGTTPVAKYDGRLWHAIEVAPQPVVWPSSFQAAMISAPLNSDLLDQTNWQISDVKIFQSDLGDGWLEGNAVVTPHGVADLLRVDVFKAPEHAAIVDVHSPSKMGEAKFFKMDGGASKFVVRFDPTTKRYLALLNTMKGEDVKPNFVRNHLVLASSTDLKEWKYHCTVLDNPDRFHHSFHYADWQVDGDDLIFVSRTSYDDDEGGADSFHNSNFITFHRLSRYRRFVFR